MNKKITRKRAVFARIETGTDKQAFADIPFFANAVKTTGINGKNLPGCSHKDR
ncbi:MAG: hypothetical protein MI799_00920 [Desulfobacterales bacterium]|nr:hypothetical protein [Desulfobacterales bacterium]